MRVFGLDYEHFVFQAPVFTPWIAFCFRGGRTFFRLTRAVPFRFLRALRVHLLVAIVLVAEGVVPPRQMVLADEIHGVPVHLEDRRRLLVEMLAVSEVERILGRPSEVERFLARRQEVGPTVGRAA